MIRKQYKNDTTLKNADAWLDDFYIGGYTYNSNEGIIYIITARGLFKAESKKAISKFTDLTPVANFKIATHRERRFEHYKQIPEYITQIEFAPNGNLVLLAPYNGIMLFNGKRTILAE